MDNLIVYKDNGLIEASYKLSLIEQRLMLYCIGKLNPEAPERQQTIIVEDFINCFPDISKANVYNQIRDAINELSERWIKVKKPKSMKEFRWVTSKEYFDDKGSAIINFSNEVMPYLCQLEGQFTKYQLRNISSFKRTYSIRMYELLSQYRTLGTRVISLEDLRIALQLEDKFKEFKELNRKVIRPSLMEINEKSDLEIEYEPIRKGRSINSIKFYIKIDTQINMFERQVTAKKQLHKIKAQLKS